MSDIDHDTRVMPEQGRKAQVSERCCKPICNETHQYRMRQGRCASVGDDEPHVRRSQQRQQRVSDRIGRMSRLVMMS